MEELHKFSDFAENDEKPLDGEKARIDNLLNRQIVLTRFKIRPSKYKDKSSDCATVQFWEYGDINQTRKIFFTGSSVIIDMLKKYEDKLPFLTTIKKIDRYYTLS